MHTLGGSISLGPRRLCVTIQYQNKYACLRAVGLNDGAACLASPIAVRRSTVATGAVAAGHDAKIAVQLPSITGRVVRVATGHPGVGMLTSRFVVLTEHD